MIDSTIGMISNSWTPNWRNFFILDDAGVAMLSGTSFGQFGEGFVRICYTANQTQINDAIKRMKKSISKLNFE